ncbi:MAG: DUF3373 family protein [Terriglobales bacterium]
MRKLISAVLILLLTTGLWAQSPSADETAQLRQELEQLKKTVAALEQKLAAQEKAQPATEEKKDTVSVPELQTRVSDLNERVNETERKTLLDRLQWSGDYRFQAHTLRANIPAHYDGMQVQNLMVKSLWFAGVNGYTPADMAGLLSSPMLPNGQPNTPANFAALLNATIASNNNYAGYQYFANNLAFSSTNPNAPGLKQMVSGFTPQQQAAFMQYLMNVPGVYKPAYNADNDILFTNRLRLKFDAKVADNVSFTARLSMYKVFGDSSGVQVFNGQPNTLAIDGTTTRVPTGDMLRVERAYFSWNNIGGSNFYLSIGRRPSTDGPPMNFREDEPRGGTPMGTLINYQFDGVTLGYQVTEKVLLRACYGVGYQSGFGNGNVLKTPADRLKDVHFFGGNFDLYATDKTLVQALVARAWDVTDGFNGEMVLPNNPVTGDPIGAPVILRFTPSANLGAINLYGLNLQKTLGPVDMFFSANANQLRPNGVTTPFGGLGSDPFDVPTDHTGTMFYAGLRYSFPQNDGRTKLGFEFNHGSKYWFNFSQAEDDIFMPKTATRGQAYETYLTHRISDRFIFKAAFQRFNYTWSGSGWHLGAPKKLDSAPMLGFPTYDEANLFTFGLTARF